MAFQPKSPSKAAITCVRKLTDSHPKGVRQNGRYLLRVRKVMRLNSLGLIDYHAKIFSFDLICYLVHFLTNLIALYAYQ